MKSWERTPWFDDSEFYRSKIQVVLDGGESPLSPWFHGQPYRSKMSPKTSSEPDR